MKEDVKLPALGENIDSGGVAKIRVSEGDTVEVDSVLLELETEKALLEMPCPVAGTVTAVKVAEGDTVKVGQVLFEVDTDSQGAAGEPKEKEEKETKSKEEKPEAKEEKKEKEEPSEEKEEAEGKEEAAEAQATDTKKEKKEDKPAKKEEAEEKPAPAKKKTEDKEEKPEADAEKKEEAQPESIPVPAGPGARKLARELGVDLKQVNGTARGGRITLDDVKAFAKKKMTEPAAGTPAQQVELPDFSQWGEVETEKLKSLRTKIADNMIRAWNAVPLVTQFDEADITDLDVLRKKEAEFVQKKGGKLTITVLVLKALVAALKAHPKFNASVDLNEGVIHYKKYYNIGVAVDTPSGLIVPVIKNVDCKSVVELAVELTEVSERARNRKVSLDELRGGNISVSNLGGIGGTAFTPLVVPPEVAVIGLARGRMQPVWKDGAFQPRLILPFCVSYDHKVIDGADGARFTRTLAEELENYTEMLLSS